MRPGLKNDLLFLFLTTAALFNVVKIMTFSTKFKSVDVFTHQTFGFFFKTVVF